MKKISSKIYFVFALLLLAACEKSGDAASPASAPAAGQGGSMARFAIVGDYLYTLSSDRMQLIDISTPSNPQYKSDVTMQQGVETIFPYQDMLFVGSQNGMLIYDNVNPAAPRLLSTYRHVTACDPVVVQGKYAYVTLRDGAPCRNSPNLLDVVDISNPRNPIEVSSYPMSNPHGLDIQGNDLFVCDGRFGLKVFDASLTPNLTEVSKVSNLHTYDAIVTEKTLLVVGDDGLYQFDYSNPKALRQVSRIAVLQ